jgi:hypothetical protein
MTIGILATHMSAGADAMPLAQTKDGISTSDTVLLVREGCGPGRQWSERRRRCVEDNPRSQIRDMMRGAERRCGRGLRWSDRRGRCVRD